jgi:peptidoglycan/LPS O-acetylase OafA/YrhL
LKYRSEIDGLRAFAVVPVILYHAGFEFFSGGFIGVDIFFVISGYLITTILIEDIKKSNFSISNFYLRRARRILPALFFVMIVCIPFAWAWMLPHELKFFSKTLLAVSFFVSNIFFWREKTNYFGGNVEENPLIHTWSLAVEEQFYIFFPIFLFLFLRFGKNNVFLIICLIAILSLLLNEWSIRNNQKQANFYLIITRAWEILVGVIAAFIVEKNSIKKNEFLSLLGLAAIFFSILIFDKSTPIPSVYALLPVLGTVFILLFATKQTFVARLLSLKILVGIGLISYSAYLWHQPIFAFVKIKLFETPSANTSVIVFLASIIIGAVSWKYIEQPFRKKSNFSGKQIFICSLSSIIFFSIVSITIYQKDGFPNRFDFEVPISPIKDNPCHNNLEAQICLKRETNKTNIFVLGDSHGSQTYTAIKNVLNKSKKHQDNIEINYQSKKTTNSFPYVYFDQIYKNIKSDPTIKSLLKNLRKNDLLIISIFSGRISDSNKKNNFENNLEQLFKILEQKEINVILQLDNPEIPYTKWIHCYDQFKKYNRSECGLDRSDYIKQIEKLTNIYENLCKKKDWCYVLSVEKLYYDESNWFEPIRYWSFVDKNHLSDFELQRLGIYYVDFLNNHGF